MARSVFILGSCMLFAPLPFTNGESAGCLVKKYVQLTDTTDVRILSFIKLNEHLDFIVQFEDRDVAYWRDCMELANSGVTHFKVRDGTGNKTTHNLPLVFREGWHNLHLQAVGTRFVLTLLSRDGGEATLLDFRLDFPISSVHVEGTFSLCSEGSPEWEVDEGEKVTVLLQLENNQQLQVTGRGPAAAYLVVPSADSDPRTDIIANTTLTIVTKRRRSTIHMEVLQNNEETLAIMEQPAAFPTLVMGCRSGTLYLRLNLSASTPKNDSHSSGPGYFVPLWPAGCLIFFAGVTFGSLMGVLVVRLCRRRKARGNKTPGTTVHPNTCEEKFLPT